MTDQSSGNLRMIDSLTTFRGGQGVGYESSLAYLRGNAAPLDGGQGLFTADLADFSTPDDGVNVIVDLVATRWKRILEQSTGTFWTVLAASDGPVSHTGNTAETTLTTVIISGGLLGVRGAIRWRAIYSYTNSANNKTMRTRFGGVGGTIYSQTTETTTASYVEERQIQNRGALNNQIGGFLSTNSYGVSANSPITSSVDTSADAELVFRAQLGSAAETITLESFIVEIARELPPPVPVPPPPPPLPTGTDLSEGIVVPFPGGVGTSLRRLKDWMGDVFNVKADYGAGPAIGDAVQINGSVVSGTDNGPRIQAAIDAAETLIDAGTISGARIVIPEGRYWVANQLVVSRSNIEIVGLAGAEIVVDDSWTDGNEIILIQGPGYGTTTTLTASVTRDNRLLTMNTTAGLALGQLFVLDNSGEYWLGITGDSGFQPITKSEMNRVRQINSATQITCELPLADDYDAITYTVDVKPLGVIQNIKVRDLIIRGPGLGSAHTGSPFGPQAIGAFHVENLEVNSCKIIDCGNTAIEATLCCDVRILNNKIHGRDNANSTNQPNISEWFYGVVFTGSINCVLDGNTFQNLRRPIDSNKTLGNTIPRNIVFAGNAVLQCQNAFGTHFGENFALVGNVCKQCPGGILLRGKNALIADNLIEVIDGNPSNAALVVGSNPGGPYAENPNAGRITFVNNKCYTRARGVFARVAVDELTIEGNSFYGGDNHGIGFACKSLKNVKIANNTIDAFNRTLTNRYGVIIEPDPNGNALEYAENIDISGNTIVNEFEGVRIEGTTPSSGLGSIGSGTATLTVSETIAAKMRAGLQMRVTGAGVAAADLVSEIVSISTAPGPTRTVTLADNAGTLVANADIYWLAPMTGLTIESNKIGRGITGPLNRGIVLVDGYFDGERTFIRDNKLLSTPTLEEILLDTERFYFSQLPTISTDNEIARQSSTVLAGKSTARVGHRIRNTAPTALSNNQWTAVAAGTAGTITGGTTGSINSGSRALTLNANADDRVFPGCFITIAGVTGVKRVVEVNANNKTQVTIDSNADATVSGAAVAYSPPLFAANDPIGNTWRILAVSAVAVSAPADTTENVLATIAIPGGAMGPNGAVRITTLWSYTNSANNKNLRVRFGGPGGTEYVNFTATTTAQNHDQREIHNRNSQSSQVGHNLGNSGGWQASTATPQTSAVNTANPADIVISGQKALAGETITLEYYMVEIVFRT